MSIDSKDLAMQLASSIDPATYLSRIYFYPYPWQKDVLNPGYSRLILNCARQAGKSSVIAAKVAHKAKYKAGALILLFAPTEVQSSELMEKISVYMQQDPEITLIRDSIVEKRLLNGSRIRAFTSTPKAARGFSDPDMIIIDEASWVDDELYMTLRPMMTGGITDMILLSTPHGKQGFFYRIWTQDHHIWKKIEVQPTYIADLMEPTKYSPRTEEEYVSQKAKQGISAYVSTRHKLGFLKEEWEVLGEDLYLQEYGCEFRETEDRVFNMDLVLTAFGHDVEPLEHDPEDLVYSDDIPMRWRE